MSTSTLAAETIISDAEVTASMRPGAAGGMELGVIKSDLDGNIRSANEAALQLLMTESIEGKKLDDLFRSPQARQVLKEQLAKRSEGQYGGYEVELTRFDGKVIPVEILGIPLKGTDGSISGALGIFRSVARDRLYKEIHRLNRSVDDPNAKLDTLVSLLKPIFKFDAISVSRYSRDFRHLKTFYINGRDLPARSELRWWPINDEQEKWLRAAGTSLIPDIEEFMREGPWQRYLDRPEVKRFIADGFKGILRKDVRKDGTLVGSIGFMSRNRDQFDGADVSMLDQLPLDHVILSAMEWNDRITLERRLLLASTLNKCTSMPEACQAFARGVMSIYSWSHVSIFRVDEISKELQPIALANQEGARLLEISKLERQALSVGVVGRAVRLGITQNVPEVAKDPDYLRISDDVHSELCIPLRFDGTGPIRFAINAEDTNAGAFSTVEQHEFEELAREFATVLFQISEVQSLTTAFENASDPIFVVDVERRVRRCNPAAASLVGQAVKPGILFDDLMADSLDFALAAARDVEDLGEMDIVTHEGARSFLTPVFVSRRRLPGPGQGAIIVVRDLTTVKRTLELEILSESAYAVASETSAALAIATAQFEAIMTRKGQDPQDTEDIGRALRQLRRVRDSYVRLASATGDYLPTADEFVDIDLPAEVKAIVDEFPEDDGKKITADGKGSPRVWASPFAVRMVIESVLGPLVRCATERGKIEISICASGKDIELSIRGRLPDIGGDSLARTAAYERGTMAVAEKYLKSVMEAMNGSISFNPLSEGQVTFLLRFAPRPT